MASANRWRCVYRGRQDSLSAAGVAQPSWHTFDRRLWQRDEYQIELTNLSALGQEGVPFVQVPKRITSYQVVLRRGSEILRREFSHDWQGLVRQMKASV